LTGKKTPKQKPGVLRRKKKEGNILTCDRLASTEVSDEPTKKKRKSPKSKRKNAKRVQKDLCSKSAAVL